MLPYIFLSFLGGITTTIKNTEFKKSATPVFKPFRWRTVGIDKKCHG